MAEKSHTPDENLQQEFNRWAEAGEGEKMRNHHLNITEKRFAAHGSSTGRAGAGSRMRLGLGDTG